MRVYPAYARTIAALAARGLRAAAVGVLLSSKWNVYNHIAKVCIRPDEWAVGRWEFGYLRNQHVIAIWGDEVEPAQYGELLLELMSVGPRLIWSLDVSGVWRQKDGDLMEVLNDAKVLLHGGRPELWQRARDEYRAGLARALDLEVRSFDRVTEKGGDVVQYLREQNAAKDLAERLFASPYGPPGEQAA